MQAFILVTLATSTGLLAGATVTDQAYGQGQSTYSHLSLVATVMRTIEEGWVGESEETLLIQGAASGMVGVLDPHSSFLNPQDYQKIREETDGIYFGIGIEVRPAQEGALVSGVVPSSPAELADIQVKDLIIMSDGLSLAGMSLDEIKVLIRGPRGTAISLILLRNGQELEKVVVRDRVVVPAVSAELFEPGLGYARIDEFQRRTGTDLKAAIATLEDQGNLPLRGLVLDLRSNPGGLVDEAIQVADLFLSEGHILEVRGKDPSTSETHLATASDEDLDIALVILVNGSSASASEIVAGSLQAHGRALLLGSNTFGKGSVQKLYELPDGSALKLTTARYFLPDGRSIEQDKGLQPDHIVESPSKLPMSWSRLREQFLQLDLDSDTLETLDSQLESIEKAHIRATPFRIRTGVDMAERLSEDAQLRTALRLIDEAS